MKYLREMKHVTKMNRIKNALVREQLELEFNFGDY